MIKFPLKHKILAIVLALVFTFQSMESINGYTYTTGVDSYHYKYGCFGAYPIHLACKCPKHNNFRNSCQLFY